MSYRIEIAHEALRAIGELTAEVRAQTRELVRELGEAPRPKRAKKLHGEPDVYRIWIAGYWRLAYAVDDGEEKLRVLCLRRFEILDYESLMGSAYVQEPAVAVGAARAVPGRRPP